MKILHFSDNHSTLPPFPAEEYDIIVCSGDFLPNGQNYLNRKEELKYQENWVRENKQRLVDWIGSKRFLFCAGNHDFYDPIPLMRQFGIDAYNITNAHHEFDGVQFYGFPYIPYTGAMWNWETTPQMMSDLFENVIKRINDNQIDVLVTHCPPYGYCDKEDSRGGQRFGSSVMVNMLKYRAEKLPQLMLCGHVHEAKSFADYPYSGSNPKMLISNAATRVQIVTYNK